MTTYQDCIDHLVDYLGGSPTDAVQRDCRRAVLESYRDLVNAFRWSYLLTQGRLITTPPFSDGTIQYQATAGPVPRAVTLTGATWPAWAVGGYIRVGFVAGKVVRRVSSTVVELDEQVTFADDALVPPGTAYKLYRDSYLLPRDFIAADQLLYERNFGGMAFIHAREWLFEERFIFAEGTPQAYTITGDPLWPGRLLLRMCPLPSDEKTVDFLYHRRPRELQLPLANTGTLAVVSGTNAVIGAGTTFSALMPGCVIRFSGTAGAPPSSSVGKNPAVFETRVDAVTDATHLTTVDPAPQAFPGVAYTVSDPIDLEEGSMLNAFYRCMEMHISMNRTLKDKPSASKQYYTSLGEAKAADSRSFTGRSVGGTSVPRQRLRDMPISFADGS